MPCYVGGARIVASFFACLTLLLWTGAPAHAESEDDQRARAHFVAAEAYFEDGRFAEAAREFEEAYQLSGRPEMLVNLARSHERAGAPREAIAALELLLSRYPQTSYRGEAEAKLEALNAQVAVGEGGEPAQGDSPAVQPGPDLAQVADEEPRSRKLWPPRWPTLAVGGAAAASLLVAVATGWAARATYNDLDQRCPGDACPPGFEDDKERGQRLARTSTGFTFAAVALGGVTAALWFLDLRTENGGQARLGVRSSATRYEANFRLTF